MKLERLFEVKDGKLYRIGGDEVPVTDKIIRKIKWSQVEGNAEEYNEEFLASLRDELKAMEEKGEFVFIEPEFDKAASVEQFTAAMKHTARRIKDCVSVIGFEIPSEVSGNEGLYMEELSAKHAQYCYLSKSFSGDNVARY